MQLEERKLKEIEHSDRRRSIVTACEYLSDASDGDQCVDYVQDSEAYKEHFSNIKYYSISQKSFAYRDKLLYPNVKGKKVLDWCCGNGEIGVEMAKHGAREIHGVDISSVAIKNAAALAEKNHVGSKCHYAVMDAENMEYDDNSFDIIHEYGALHHVDLEAAYAETSRVLKPSGKFICTEAMRHNPLIHAYRKKTPTVRTEWEVEHILGVPEIKLGKKYFKKVKIRHFHLAAIAAVPFRRTPIFKPLLAGLNLIDTILLRIPYFRRLSWVAVIEFSSPRPQK